MATEIKAECYQCEKKDEKRYGGEEREINRRIRLLEHNLQKNSGTPATDEAHGVEAQRSALNMQQSVLGLTQEILERKPYKELDMCADQCHRKVHVSPPPEREEQ